MKTKCLNKLRLLKVIFVNNSGSVIALTPETDAAPGEYEVWDGNSSVAKDLKMIKVGIAQ